tara:strand:- start:341 stop:634 length:294 start_codon:yes stop_codon:yes gene_type:complete
MNLESKKIIKQLRSKLLIQTLVTQTIIDLLIDKGFFTYSEFNNSLKETIEDMGDTVIENTDLMHNISSFLEEEFDSNNELEDDSVMKGMFYGPMGEA